MQVSSPEKAPPQRQASRDAFVGAMRHVASSIAVVSTDGPAGLQGATVTAFCSVSADPPTLLVCLRTGSRICSAVTANGVFTLNVMPENGQSVARVFSGEFDARRPDRFEGIPLVEQDGLAPAISGVLSFSCQIVRTERQETHTIVVGKVADIAANQQVPLTYFDGAYCSLHPQPKSQTVEMTGAPVMAWPPEGSR
jgi:flavin reductase (DIM6/NTAB) family NADH-FMN oxidoreductase RutF